MNYLPLFVLEGRRSVSASVDKSRGMEYFNLEMDRSFGSVDLRPLFLSPHRCYTIILTMYYKASNESYEYHLSIGTL